MLQKEGSSVPMESVPVQEENKQQDIPMQTKRTIKKDLIQIFLDHLEKVGTRDEAAKLTELLLERYKGRWGEADF